MYDRIPEKICCLKHRIYTVITYICMFFSQGYVIQTLETSYSKKRTEYLRNTVFYAV